MCFDTKLPFEAAPPGLNCDTESVALRFASDVPVDNLAALNAALALVHRISPLHFRTAITDEAASFAQLTDELNRLAYHCPAYGGGLSDAAAAEAVAKTLLSMREADHYYVIRCEV